MINPSKAWLLQNHSITLGSKTIGELPDGSVLIKNSAIGINPVDWKLIEGNLGHFQLNHIPGVDGVGYIVQVGSRAKHLKIGARVAYHTNLTQDGSFSEYTLVDARALIPVPELLDDVSAAAFPCPGLTAWQSVQKLPKVKGKRILVNGAGGAVGSLIYQMLIQQGALVYAVASKKRHEALAHFGVIESIDYHDENWLASLSKMKFYAALDMVNGKSAEKLAPLLEFYGHLVSVQDRVEKAPLPAFTTSISLHEIALGSQHIYGSDQQWQELVKAGSELLFDVAVGALTLPKIQVVSFDKIDEALGLLKKNNDGTKYVAVFS